MINHLISIILPVYNGEKFIEEAVRSCLNQTYVNFELIIVNDSSYDRTLEIILNLQKDDDRIKVISNTKNKNLPCSLNIGHKYSKGKFITWTSHDNILKPNFLDLLYKAIVSENTDVVYSNYDIIHENGKVKRRHEAGPVSHLLFGNTIGASFLYRRTVYKKLKGYDENLHTVEDYDFWLRAVLNFDFYHLKKNIYQYRLHSNSLTSKIRKDESNQFHFRSSIYRIFTKLQISLGLRAETLYFLTKVNAVEKFNYYKKNRKIIYDDIHKFQRQISETSTLNSLNKLNLSLRSNLKREDVELTLKLLFWILLHQPSILIGQNYSRKESFKLLIKPLSNKK